MSDTKLAEVEEIVDGWVTDHPVETITPYRCITLLNTILEANGMKSCPTQMGYNYAKKQYIKNTDKVVTPDDCKDFLNKYLNNKARRIADAA